MNYNILNIILVFIITVIVAYLFGLVLINTIDNRLKNINLNIPKQDIIINYPENNIENFENKIGLSEYKTYDFKKGKRLDTNYDNDYYIKKEKDSKIEGYVNEVDTSYKEWNIEKKKTQVCCKNHVHIKNGRDINCTYGVTNYADPKDMSPVDYKIFNLNYPSNMTLQDYINWLYCYIGKESQLPYNHLKNLEKIKMGKELIPEEGVLPPPGYYFPSMDAKDYFDKMYNGEQEFNIAGPLNSTTGPMMGYNYNDYSDFLSENNMNGTSGEIRNPDIGKKKNAKKLFDYVNPRDSNSINIDNEYQIYRMKNVEI
jgi:hypothetical protein